MVGQWDVIVENFVYAIGGGSITIFFLLLTFKIIDTLTPFSLAEEIKKGNRAAGLVVCGIFLSIGIAMGLVIGLGLS
jgi:uncharacterized membrane protein YjfL (UPF0719 family)